MVCFVKYQELSTGKKQFIVTVLEYTTIGRISSTRAITDLTKIGIDFAKSVLTDFEKLEEYGICEMIKKQINESTKYCHLDPGTVVQ